MPAERRSPPGDGDPLAIGVITGAHGIHGALRVRLHNPASAALRVGLEVSLSRGGGRHRVEAVTAGAGARPLVRVELSGVNDREAAEALRGCSLQVARADLPELAADEFYLQDVIGARVEREVGGEHLGEIRGVVTGGLVDLLEVVWRSPAGQEHTWLLPAAPPYLVAVDEGRVRVELPAGLLPEPLERGGEA